MSDFSWLAIGIALGALGSLVAAFFAAPCNSAMRPPDEERELPYPHCGRCTRQATLDGRRHICGVDGPCNGLPRPCQDCGAYPANCEICRKARGDGTK